MNNFLWTSSKALDIESFNLTAAEFRRTKG